MQSRFAQHFAQVQRGVESRFGVAVHVAPVAAPNTGDFDGARIVVSQDQDPESALFVLLHLFGHTVQWNVSPPLRELGLDTAVGKSEAELVQVLAYERDATRHGLALLRGEGIADLDQWASDWWEADWSFLAHFYRTGERRDVRALLKPGSAVRLAPLAIPAFTPTAYRSRWSF